MGRLGVVGRIGWERTGDSHYVDSSVGQKHATGQHDAGRDELAMARLEFGR